ncbi:MAG: hypothetical protein JXP34_27470 [Planctomycetes bacterium]|nr:hypothetical protein [Planctomycetota bacterium]
MHDGRRRIPETIPLSLACAMLFAGGAFAQMVTGPRMDGFAKTFGLEGRGAKDFAVAQIASTAGANVLWPGEQATLTFRITNTSADPLRIEGRIDGVRYGTRARPGDIWRPVVFKIADLPSMPIPVDIPAKGDGTVTVATRIPETFGAYGLVVDLGERGRAFAATLVRVPAPDPGREWLPTYALDLPWPHEMSREVLALFKRLGVKAARMEAGYCPTDAPDLARRMARLDPFLGWALENDVTVMLTLGASSAPMPLGRGRPWLNDDGSMKQGVKEDLAWLPAYDADFRKWVAMILAKHGWPKGPVNAVELWNEPWEGVSISGWGADMIRYREIYTQMALGVEDARREHGAEVLIGGACSSSNTRDKFFADGSDTFLKWLDFVSIHYQPLAADPALEPAWIGRKAQYGPVRVWDTESWVANSEDKIAGVIASMRAQGQSRTAGIYGGNVYTSEKPRIDGREYAVVQAWAPAAGVAAVTKWIGQRPFEEILFKNGLPWVFVFGGRRKADPDDGTLVVLGDLGGVYERDRTLFRGVRIEPDAKLTLPDGGGAFRLLDFYGNPVPAEGGKITIPLNALGCFLRTDGSPGSFARLRAAVAAARIDGYDPIDVAAHDLIAPIETKPPLRLTLTNILNRPIEGRLEVKLGALALEAAAQDLSFAAHETKRIAIRIAGGAAAPENIYPLALSFDAGPDGRKTHEEAMRVNVIARRTIGVDGRLDDWKGALPQPVGASQGILASLTEKAWLPFESFDRGTGKGLAVGFVACDDAYFYFAAKIADDTPHSGGVRFETRDDDAYFYPETCTDRGKTLAWPAGVRRFSYRKGPDLPSGNGTDSVQLAFNVLPAERKRLLPFPPGTMPRFMAYEDTDYEYAFLPVAERFGGGTEIWRLLAPGVPRKHFYPRQPRAPIDGGPVKGGRLVMRRDGATRILEAAIPWSEIPEAKRRRDAGGTVKLSFRVNDDRGPAYELAAGRSVSKENFLAFHDDWRTHWANEIEFGFDR